MTEDIVCSKPLPPGAETWECHYHGQIFYFCSLECKERFELEPEDYFTVTRLRRILPPVVLVMR